MPQYSGVWSLQQQMQALTSGQWATDPLFDYTTLLLQGDAGANGAQNNVFYDTSPNQFAITRNGNTTQGTFSPFSATGWSNFFDGNGDELNAGSNSAFSFGTGAYTVEMWVFPVVASTSYSAGNGPCLFFNDATNGFGLWDPASIGITISQRAGADILNSSTHLVEDQWNHVVAVRSGTSTNQTSIFLNGSRIANGTDATNWTVTGPAKIGGIALSNYYLNGYASNVRVVKGTAVYDPTQTTLTVPTAPLTAITNTSLLTCQSNRFIDNSNAFAITVSGNTSVQAFSPFAPQFQYTASGTGGSGYFDGTTDYLQLASPTSAVAPGSGDFTFSVWIYPVAFTSPVAGILDIANAANATRFAVILYANGKIYVDNNTNLLISANAVPLNAWTYVSVVRSGSTMTIYYNGVSQASGTVTQNFTDTTTYIGRSFDGYHFQGYMSGMRLVKGSALAATTPTAPLTAVTNTQLLCNFTNAGILDGTMKNNLETVGGASVSTSVVKYGSGSMYFDGTGDRLAFPTSQNAAFGTGDFTVEMWVYPNSFSTSPVLFDTRNVSTNTAAIALTFDTSGNPKVYVNGGFLITGSSPAALSSWSHLAMVKLNGVIRLYLNGVSVGSSSSSTSLTDTAITIGDSINTAGAFNGYIDDLRITKGIARYTQNFIPPSVALPRQ
jgi:hypothetical protein